ncbi:hypothetical protein C8R44DRAFT_812422 [Mycena epipterygia]|nr:hypothetical protein C8R44DRAFT_812422 [Mycena epipterygia]
MIYHPVVCAMSRDWPPVLGGKDIRFMQSTLFMTWLFFVELVEERFKVLEHFHSPEYASTKACDGPQCGLIKNTADVKRCSGCRVHHYCSLECQKSAWREHHSLGR